ncbi:hypothetical protein GGR08_001203 [Bartonella fuyuanensis]|uniref:Uncharacterized protein n=1 Tax=Bartonella fuyuanensis TaxID=1460968 RepID=A0A840DZG2_9HYPH|nr:hypothetical protein [Bartonella fuyuanensis]
MNWRDIWFISKIISDNANTYSFSSVYSYDLCTHSLHYIWKG